MLVMNQPSTEVQSAGKTISMSEYRAQHPERNEEAKKISANRQLGETACRIDVLETRPRRELAAFINTVRHDGDLETIKEVLATQSELQKAGLSDNDVLEGVSQLPRASKEWHEMRQQITTLFVDGELELADELGALESKLRREGATEQEIITGLYGHMAVRYEEQQGVEVKKEDLHDPWLPDEVTPKTGHLHIIK